MTTGLMRILDRDELQGVVAHELGHIKNRDVALIVTAGVMVGAIAMLADVGRRALFYGGMSRSRSGRDRSGGGAIVMVFAILMLILAPIFAQLMYFALSRRREFLADASGARFTRYPEGLARALEKLGGAHVPQQDQSKVTAPMYIVPPVHPGAMAARGGGGSIFSTHPPLEQRVRVLRAMGGGAGVADYLRAYQQVTGGRLLKTMPEDAVPAARRGPASQAARGAGAAVAGLAAAAPVPPPLPAVESPEARMRAASNALLTAGGWTIVPCAGCSAAIKVPPALKGAVTRCPRCGTRLN